MCKCGKNTGDFCNNCSGESTYNHYYAEPCTSCGDGEIKCKKTIEAKCVINTEDLDFLGVSGEDNVDVQTILISINNALESISNMLCMEYTRVVNPTTGVATYDHNLNFDCIAENICPICNEET